MQQQNQDATVIEVRGSARGLAITQRYMEFVEYVYPMTINWSGKHRVFRDVFLGRALDQVALFNDAGKSNQISRLYLADSGLATLREYLRFATNPARKLMSRLSHVFPCFSDCRAQYGFIRNKRIGFCNFPCRLTRIVPRANFCNIVAPQLCVSVLFPSSVISSVPKGIINIFLDCAVFQVAQHVMQRVSVKMPRDNGSWHDPNPTLKHKSVDGNEFRFSVLSDSALSVWRSVFRLNRELRHFLPMVCASPWAASGVSRLALCWTGKNPAIVARCVAIKRRVTTNVNARSANINFHNVAIIDDYIYKYITMTSLFIKSWLGHARWADAHNLVEYLEAA